MLVISHNDNHLKCDDTASAKVQVRKLKDGDKFSLTIKSPGTGAKRTFHLKMKDDAQPHGIAYQQDALPFRFSTIERITNFQ